MSNTARHSRGFDEQSGARRASGHRGMDCNQNRTPHSTMDDDSHKHCHRTADVGLPNCERLAYPEC